MNATVTGDVAFSPGLTAADPSTRAWLLEATLRLRREVAWRWHQRGGAADGSGRLPATDGSVVDSLDLRRHWTEKQAFFREDVAARYLSEQIVAAHGGDDQRDGQNGSASEGAYVPSWTIRGVRLDAVSSLALGLGLLARADAASGAIFGACLGDGSRTEPSLALVQRLADHPGEALSIADPGHILWRSGLIQPIERATSSIPWDVGYGVPPVVAAHLLDPDGPWPASLTRLGRGDGPEPAGVGPGHPVTDRIRIPPFALRVVPVDAPAGADVPAAVAALAEAVGRDVALVGADAAELAATGALHPLITLAWLSDVDLLVTERLDGMARQPGRTTTADALAAAGAVPITVFLRAGRETLGAVPRDLALPAVRLAPFTFEERIARWRRSLGPRAKELDAGLDECARRFRFEAETIDEVAAGLRARPSTVSREELFAACRAVIRIDMHGLAQPVAPRFTPDELILPGEQRRQFDEIERAMRSLTVVHHGWGTGRAWNEAGISVLFAGPSGTGKTMAAEVLAVALDLPMYRVNLAQVVDKFIGETEKNLERVFDAADASDSILFFDEADALFGRRTEVKDAHDRYANLEVSYLLERMERFKGLAILATNRRGDLDDAFLRRLRYIVDFPVPDAAERRRIWASAIPRSVATDELDLDFLAKQFQLTGGNIRSAVLNACLQAAAQAPAGGAPGRPVLGMEHVLVAVKREHDKFQRAVGPAQFGAYAPLIEAARA